MSYLIVAARAFADAFEARTRDNGAEFMVLRDGSPEWMVEAIERAHDGMMPDDRVYDMAHTSALNIAQALENDSDADLDGLSSECADNMVSPYHSDRFEWLSSHFMRAEYCDQAAHWGLVAPDTNISDRAAAGWYREADHIFGCIRRAIEDHVEA